MLHMNLNIVRRLLWEHLKIHVFSLPQTKISAFSFFYLQSGWISNTGWFRVSSFCRFSISKPVLPDSCRLGVRSFALFRHGRLVSLMNWCRSVHKLTLPHAICNYRNAFTHFSLVTVIMELQVLKNSSTVKSPVSVYYKSPKSDLWPTLIFSHLDQFPCQSEDVQLYLYSANFSLCTVFLLW